MLMSEFSYYTLLSDLILNLLGIVLGVWLLAKAADNRLKIFWGIGIIVCSLSMFIDNLQWLNRYLSDFGLDERSDLFVFPRMMKWFFFAHILSMFPIASLRPGWLRPWRIIMFALPFLLPTLICLCYIWFNGQMTAVATWKEVIANLDKTDIQMRLGYFVLSVVSPTICFLIPFMGGWINLRRHSTTGMYLYISSLFLLLVLYILFITGTTDVIFTIYGFIVTFLPNVLTAFYIYRENPISAPNEGDIVQEQEVSVSLQVYRLSMEMREWMQAETPFIDSDYSIKQLAKDLRSEQRLVVKAIEYNGFVGFKEYMNHLRVELLKDLAKSFPDMLAKDLLFRCGFPSKSELYRYCKGKENMSASEYAGKYLMKQ